MLGGRRGENDPTLRVPQPPSLAPRGPAAPASREDGLAVPTMHGGPAPSLASMTVVGSHVLDEDLFGDLFDPTPGSPGDEGSATKMGLRPSHTSFGQTIIGTRTPAGAPQPVEDAWLDDVTAFLRDDTEAESLRPLMTPFGYDPASPSVGPARAAEPTGPQQAITELPPGMQQGVRAPADVGAAPPLRAEPDGIGTASGILRRPGKRSRPRSESESGAMASAGTYLGGTATGPHGAVRPPATGNHAPVRHTPSPMAATARRLDASPAPANPVSPPPASPIRSRTVHDDVTAVMRDPRAEALRELANAETGAMPAIGERDDDPFGVLQSAPGPAQPAFETGKIVSSDVGPTTAASPAFLSADTVPHASSFDADTLHALRELQREVRDVTAPVSRRAGADGAPAPQFEEATPGQFRANAPAPQGDLPIHQDEPGAPVGQEREPAEQQALEAATRAEAMPAARVRLAAIAIVVGCVLVGAVLVAAVLLWIS